MKAALLLALAATALLLARRPRKASPVPVGLAEREARAALGVEAGDLYARLGNGSGAGR